MVQIMVQFTVQFIKHINSCNHCQNFKSGIVCMITEKYICYSVL